MARAALLLTFMKSRGCLLFELRAEIMPECGAL